MLGTVMWDSVRQEGVTLLLVTHSWLISHGGGVRVEWEAEVGPSLRLSGSP